MWRTPEGVPQSERRRWREQPPFEELGRERLDEGEARRKLYPSTRKQILVAFAGLSRDWRRNDPR